MSPVQSFTNAPVQSVVTSGVRASQHHHNNNRMYTVLDDIMWTYVIGPMTEATGLNIWDIPSLCWYELLVE